MPTIKSAKKDLRQNRKRRARNRNQRSSLRTSIKKVRLAAAGEDIEAAQDAFRLAQKRLDQAVAKKLIHKNKAARTKSRLAKLLPRTAAAAAE